MYGGGGIVGEGVIATRFKVPINHSRTDRRLLQ